MRVLPEILPMAPCHLEAVAAMEKECFSLPWSLAAFQEELECPNAVYLVALVDGEVAGYGGMRHAAGEFYIDNIAASPRRRRQGIGRAVLSALVERARELDGAFISLEVRPSNRAALGLYEQLGFEPVGRRKNFYEKPREDALILTRRFEEG